MKSGLQTVTLLVLMIILVVAVLGVLGAATAHSDLEMARKQADTATGMQDCVNQAQSWLADISAEPDADGYFENSFSDGQGHSLFVELRAVDGEVEILRWENRTEWTDSQAIGGLFQLN